MKKYVIIFGLLLVLSVVMSVINPFTYSMIRGRRINCLIIGVDNVIDGRHSDAIIFASYNPVTKFLDLISIPRDTKISVPGLAIKKINELYAAKYLASGSDRVASVALKEKVEEILDVKIPFYVQLDFQGFSNFIDGLGGITIGQEQLGEYNEILAASGCMPSSGTYVFDGARALEYVRYRMTDRADLDRMIKQQEFICEVISRSSPSRIAVSLPRFAGILYKHIHTNLSFWDMITVVRELKEFKVSSTRLQVLAGRPVRKVWVLDDDSVANSVHLVTEGRATDTEKFPTYSDLVVEVFNASGERGLAEKARRDLLAKKIDVIKIGDYDGNSRYARTVVIDRLGQPEKSQRVADTLGTKIVLTKIDETRGVDVTVILGQDWQNLKNVWEK
jgi:LCP family protein required for cell wall assembly